MKENKRKKLPKFNSVDALVKFFDTHDMGDYLSDVPETHFEVDIKSKRHVFTLQEDIADKVTRIARSKKVPSEALLNLWVREKILEKA